MRIVPSKREDSSVGKMINFSQGELAELLFCSILCGAAFGGIYDVIRAFRMLCGVRYDKCEEKCSTGRSVLIYTVTLITDLLFWVCAGCAAILLMYSSGGVFRGMTFTGMMGGFLLYYFTLGRLILNLNRKLISFFKKLIWRFVILMRKPIKKTFGGIILLYHLTIGKIIDKIIEDRKEKREEKQNAEESEDEPCPVGCGKEGFVYVDGKTGYRRDGRVSFGSRSK